MQYANKTLHAGSRFGTAKIFKIYFVNSLLALDQF